MPMLSSEPAPVVAPALDLRIGRDPFADQIEPNMRSVFYQVKPEVSTLQKTGSFYFALTLSSMFLDFPGAVWYTNIWGQSGLKQAIPRQMKLGFRCLFTQGTVLALSPTFEIGGLPW